MLFIRMVANTERFSKAAKVFCAQRTAAKCRSRGESAKARLSSTVLITNRLKVCVHVIGCRTLDGSPLKSRSSRYRQDPRQRRRSRKHQAESIWKNDYPASRGLRNCNAVLVRVSCKQDSKGSRPITINQQNPSAKRRGVTLRKWPQLAVLLVTLCTL